MWMNLHTLPSDQAMFTIGLAVDPIETPEDERYIEEIDFVAPRGLDSAAIIARARLAGVMEDFARDSRVVGVINQSDGYVLRENWEGIE